MYKYNPWQDKIHLKSKMFGKLYKYLYTCDSSFESKVYIYVF